jgi:Type IV secretion system pilin
MVIGWVFPMSAAAAEVTVTVTEKIPGANCVPVGSGSGVTNRKFKCTVEWGFATVQKMLGGLIKYATFITALVWVLMVVFSGLQYATSAGNTEAQKSAVGRIQNLIMGLVLLFLVGFILNTIAPWVYR